MVLDLGIIDLSIYKTLNCTNGNLPRCYELPKIHKVDSPLRIIVSTLRSPLYYVSRFLHEILVLPINKPKSSVKNGWSYVNIIKSAKIGNEDLLVSLDVSSLFTNIPHELIVKAIRNWWPQISRTVKFS